MLSARYLLVPFVLQMLCMAVDEFHYHWRRKLPRWERFGHPLDTLTVLLCLLWLIFVKPSSSSVTIYILLSVFSCLFVTKDESVHHGCCARGEQWLHALLFTLHPLILLSAGLLWPALHADNSLSLLLRYEGFERIFLLSATGLTLAFGLYQLIFWNLLWRPVSTTK